MPDYRLIVAGEENKNTTKPTIPTQPTNSIPTVPTGSTKSVTKGMGKNIVENSISQFVVSPLNSATGGLASPAYSIGKAVATGGAVGSAIGSALIVGVTLAINEIEKRVAKMESKAEEMNNKDNTLIRAGTTSVATFYSGNVFGVSSTNRT